MSEISDLEEEIQMLRREREQLGMRLLELQQHVASASVVSLEKHVDECNVVEQELQRQIRDLQAENAAIRDTLTWRISGPVRKLRGYLKHT